MLFLFALGSIVMLAVSITVAFKNHQLQEQLARALATTYSTPIKELASSFREFVESVDGKVSPEVDEAIKKLEASETIKQLPANQNILDLRDQPSESVDAFIQRYADESKAIEKAQSRATRPSAVEVDERPWLTEDLWKLCREELDDESYDNGVRNAVEHWGKRYRFTMAQQVRAIKTLSYDSEKAKLRKYFDQNH